MPVIQVRITNLPQIRAAFSKAPLLTARRVNEAIRKSIFDIERESKTRTPVRTGYLRGSHQTQFSNLRGEVRPVAFYSVFVHEGTRFMRGRPFLLNAVKSAEGRIQDFFTQAVQKVLDEIARDTH